MSKKKHRYSWGDGKTYAIVRLRGKYYWSVFSSLVPRLLAQGRSNNRRGAFYAARCYIKRHQNEVFG